MTVKVVDSEIEWFISRESHEAEGNETWVFRSLNTIEADISVEVENVENLEELTEEETTKLKLIKNHGENYVCFCGFLSPDIRLFSVILIATGAGRTTSNLKWRETAGTSTSIHHGKRS